VCYLPNSVSPPSESLIGHQLQQYRVTALLGRGGMGVVYSARDVRLERDVALKLLPAEFTDDNRRDRFLREARTASALSHPNIITIYEVDSADGLDFIVMELIAGRTLQESIPPGGFAIPLAEDYGRQMLEGMAAAHRVGLVHRDLKPGNLMIRDDGVLKILDFGLATLRVDDDAQTEARLTAVGHVLGTAAYMSPEQARGEAVGPPSDVFSMGVILYQMVTGQSPFRGSGLSVLHALIEGTYERPQRVRPDCPLSLEGLIAKALARTPGDRFATAGEMLNELRVAIGLPFSIDPLPAQSIALAPARPSPPAPASWRSNFSSRAAAGVATVVALTASA
jgi:eukaryotic-like serine/threonine-protein kinase